MSEPKVDNEGTGNAPFLTMYNSQSPTHKVHPQDIEEGRSAVGVLGNNIAGKGRGVILGKAIWVSEDGQLLAVACRGVVRLKYSEPKPILGEGVCLNGKGGVRWESLNMRGRGVVISIDEEKEMCDIFLG